VKIQESKLEQAVNDFAEVMKQRLAQKECEGYKGWDCFTVGDIEYACTQIIYDAVDIAKNPTSKRVQKLSADIANRAMMIAYRE